MRIKTEPFGTKEDDYPLGDFVAPLIIMDKFAANVDFDINRAVIRPNGRGLTPFTETKLDSVALGVDYVAGGVSGC